MFSNDSGTFSTYQKKHTFSHSGKETLRKGVKRVES